jgi:hypothetical protein
MLPARILIAADGELLPVVSYYLLGLWQGLGLNDNLRIVEHMLDHFDQSLYEVRLDSSIIL